MEGCDIGDCAFLVDSGAASAAIERIALAADNDLSAVFGLEDAV